ncbi:MAG: YaiO family outer membrane beta-barrel protein [Bradymonadaceae bacterium]
MGYYILALLFAVSGVLDRADQALKKKDYDHAVKLYGFALDEDPDSYRALVGMARAYAFSGRRKKAIETYSKALELHPGSNSALLGRARVYMWMDRWEKAWKDLQRAKEIDPTSSDLWQAIGDYHRYRDDYQKSYDAYSRWIELSPLSAQAHLSRARIGKYVVSPEQVRRDLDKAEELGAPADEIQSIRVDLLQDRQEGWEAGLKYRFAALDEGFDNWHTVQPKIKKNFDAVSISAAYILTRRFDKYDHAGVLTSYFDLWSSAYGSLRVQGSPKEPTSILATFDASARINQSLGKGWVGTGGYRFLFFSTDPIHLTTLQIAKYLGSWYLSADVGGTFSESDVEGDTSTEVSLSYGAAVRYYYGSADDYVELDGGIGETRLDQGRFIGRETFEYSVGASVQKFFSSRYGGSVSVGYKHFEDIPNRFTISTGATVRW